MIAAVLIIGVLLIDSAMQNTQSELGALLQRDLIGSQGFIVWIICVAGLGAIGYIPGLERTSRNLILLLLVVLVLRNGGIWQQAQTALQNVSAAGPAPSTVNPATSSTGSSTASSSSGGSGLLGDVGAIASIASFF